MARSFVQRGSSFIGRARKSRPDVARERLDEALATRGYVFDRIDDTPGGKIAIAVNGRHIMVHLGRDEADAMLRLASAAVRP